MLTETQKQLVEEHLLYAENYAGKFRKRLPKFISFDELKCATYMGLVKAAKGYEESKTTHFCKYASVIIHYEVIEFLREGRWGQKRRQTSISNMKSIYTEGNSKKTILDNSIGDEDIQHNDVEEVFNNFRKYVSEREFTLLWDCYINKRNAEQISKTESVSASRIRQIIERAVNKIKSGLEKDSRHRGTYAYELLNEGR